MNVEGCWSTVICNASERAAVGYTGKEWTLQCRLSSGHDGNHATDGDRGALPGRRRWLEWTDFSEYPHSLLERDPCPVAGRSGAPCQLYSGHGGMHFYAPSTSRSVSQPTPRAGTHHATGPQPVQAQPPESYPGSGRRGAQPRPATPAPAPRGTDYRGGHRMADETDAEVPAQPAPTTDPNGVEHRRSSTIERIDATIRESMELLAEEQRAVPEADDVSADDAAVISDALSDVAGAFERLAQAYRSVGQ